VEKQAVLSARYVKKGTTAIWSYALRRTAEDNHREFPDLLAKVTENFYVDNYLDSFEITSEAVVKSKEMSDLLAKGGFKLGQWGSSSKVVLASVPGALLSNPSLNLDLDELPTERTLGLKWNCQRDAFEMTTQVDPKSSTKRSLLRAVSSIFHPLGFLTPVVLTARVILQDLWRGKIDWDDAIPTQLRERWLKWADTLRNLESISIPRCYRRSIDSSISVQLHTFSDASKVGFGAVVYLRLETEGGVEVAFVIAKSRVAPLRLLTIPRLELSGAVLACRLAATVKNELRIKVDKSLFWTYSTTVLRWINSRSCRFHTFVANRIGEILEKTQENQWRHVPTKINPADDCSRGVDASELSADHRWFAGPEFLTRPSVEWPQFPDASFESVDVDPRSN
jgi:hypothetical protein